MSECSCEKCQSACSHKPGWFLPEQITPLAEYLKITEQELFDQYLLVDYVQPLHSEDYVFVLSPGTKGHPTGTEFPGDPRGECIWFEEGKCKIHPVKPYECSHYDHTVTIDEVEHEHRVVIPEAWENKKDYIEGLLGREPEWSDWFPNPYSYFSSSSFIPTGPYMNQVLTINESLVNLEYQTLIDTVIDKLGNKCFITKIEGSDFTKHTPSITVHFTDCLKIIELCAEVNMELYGRLIKDMCNVVYSRESESLQ